MSSNSKNPNPKAGQASNPINDQYLSIRQVQFNRFSALLALVGADELHHTTWQSIRTIIDHGCLEGLCEIQMANLHGLANLHELFHPTRTIEHHQPPLKF